MIKWRYCPELVQFHGYISVVVLLDTPPGSPKNCPEAKGGSVRVQISLLKPVSFYMVKPMFCPSRDQSSPVKSSIGVVEFHLELREDRVAYRVECSRCYMADLLVVMLVLHVLCHIGRTTTTSGAKPAHARHVLGWTSISSVSYSAGSRKPLIRWIGKTHIDGVLTLSPKSGLGWWILKLRGIIGWLILFLFDCWFPLLEARSWQEAKSNLVTVALGHDILVFRSYDLTGAFPRTAVRHDDPIQDRGHDKPLIHWIGKTQIDGVMAYG
ncbi:hypothetical protein F2Q69_00037622 [Brassica cretica]|uniref:Uncharacterized protein n=1 Tax=Brassica cretica TaxID=69181 RepID=A0A8S9SE73_BRACR|nr:hypothetical protein F2Q69_00037622 [Brassica cretica]